MHLAVLGPAETYSHQLARDEFPEAELHLLSPFSKVLEHLVEGQSEAALIPFYNTYDSSVLEALRELMKHQGTVFVQRVLWHSIHHCAGGFCAIENVKALWSKLVVRSQVSAWLRRNQLSTAPFRDFDIAILQ